MRNRLLHLSKILSAPGLTDRHRRIELMELLLRCHADGDMIEVGCNSGVTSALLQYLNMKTLERDFHVYDTFEGLAGKTEHDKVGPFFDEGELKATREELEANFERFKQELPFIHEGRAENAEFPDRIGFAYVDLDYYAPTLEVLHAIWPKMTKGSVLVMDDYNFPQLPGIKKAVDEFFRSEEIEERGILCVVRK